MNWIAITIASSLVLFFGICLIHNTKSKCWCWCRSWFWLWFDLVIYSLLSCLSHWLPKAKLGNSQNIRKANGGEQFEMAQAITKANIADSWFGRGKGWKAAVTFREAGKNANCQTCNAIEGSSQMKVPRTWGKCGMNWNVLAGGHRTGCIRGLIEGGHQKHKAINMNRRVTQQRTSGLERSYKVVGIRVTVLPVAYVRQRNAIWAGQSVWHWHTHTHTDKPTISQSASLSISQSVNKPVSRYFWPRCSYEAQPAVSPGNWLDACPSLPSYLPFTLPSSFSPSLSHSNVRLDAATWLIADTSYTTPPRHTHNWWSRRG